MSAESSQARSPLQPVDLVGSGFKGRGRNYLELLACPVDHTSLTLADGAVVCSADAAHVYAFDAGILRLLPAAARAGYDARSAAHDETCRTRGWTVPDEAGFKSLPQTPLDGWPDGYWAGQAEATALLWRFLEAIRLQNGMLPVGPMGEAVVLDAGMGWLAYALDVAGYTTLAIDPHAGPSFGLGVYPIARYLRVQADTRHAPLAPEALDVVVFQEGLAYPDDDAAQQRLFESALAALRPGGWVAVIDAVAPSEDHADTVHTLFEDAGLMLLAAPRRVGWRGRLLELRDRLMGRQADVPPVMVAQKRE